MSFYDEMRDYVLHHGAINNPYLDRFKAGSLSDTEFKTQEGTLYPMLSKLRREGLVDYEWQESDAGPPRKYYELTARGKTQLAELNAYWKDINATITELER